MTPLNNISINTLDKAYNVLGVTKSEELKETKETLKEVNNENQLAVDNQIDYNVYNTSDSEQPQINSQDELKNILANVKNKIESSGSMDIYSSKLSDKVLSLLQ